MGGIFPQEAVSTLCRLAGWSEGSGVWSMYVRDVFEHSSTQVDFCIAMKKNVIPI